MTTPASKPVRKLTEIFAETDTVSYGPFSLSINGDNKFKKAELSVHGVVIPLGATEKKVMALLIAQQGEYLTLKMYDEATENKRISSPKNLQLYISSIRRKIEEQLTDMAQPDETIALIKEYFQSANPVRSKGEKGDTSTDREMYSAYRLNVPSLHS